jgi:hypothetical protein
MSKIVDKEPLMTMLPMTIRMERALGAKQMMVMNKRRGEKNQTRAMMTCVV